MNHLIKIAPIALAAAVALAACGKREEPVAKKEEKKTAPVRSWSRSATPPR